MDPMIAQPSSFEVAFQEFIFYAGPTIQLIYWLAMVVAAFWAVTLFKRWVDSQASGVRGAGQADTPDPVASSPEPASEKPVSVDEFVE